jgi:hypothetical protein
MPEDGPRCSECSKMSTLLVLIRSVAPASTPPLIALTLLVHEVRGFVGS